MERALAAAVFKDFLEFRPDPIGLFNAERQLSLNRAESNFSMGLHHLLYRLSGVRLRIDMEVVPGMFPLQSLPLLSVQEVDEQNSGIGMLRMHRDAHVQLDSLGDLSDRRVAQRGSPFLVTQGVILANQTPSWQIHRY